MRRVFLLQIDTVNNQRSEYAFVVRINLFLINSEIYNTPSYSKRPLLIRHTIFVDVTDILVHETLPLN